jgi:hypothetical protein
MKQKLRDRLDRIEQALKALIKEVGKMHPVSHPPRNGEHDDPASPALQTPKANTKTGQKTLRKARTRTSKS